MRRVVTIAMTVGLAGSLAACSHGKKPRTAAEAPARLATIGVNAYLWQAALDTLSFLPMASVDSNGGVLVSDWYAAPATPNERIKVTVAILDTELRADAIRVSVSRQQLAGSGWVEAPVRAGTVQKLEEAILGKARDLRRAQIGG